MVAAVHFVAVLLGAMATVAADEYFEGDGTSYTLGQVSSGNCNFMSAIPTASTNFVALNQEQWNTLGNCGRCIEVSCIDEQCTAQNKTAVVQVLDRCPECAYGALDLSPTVYKEITGLDPNRLTVRWRFVDCPDAGNLQVCLKEGSNSNWIAVQPTNGLVGVESVTVNDATTTMLDGAYYYVSTTSNADLSAVKVAITSVNGDVISGTYSLTAGECTDTNKQFGSDSYSQSQSQTTPVTTTTPATSPAPVAPTATPTSTTESTPIQTSSSVSSEDSYGQGSEADQTVQSDSTSQYDQSSESVANEASVSITMTPVATTATPKAVPVTPEAQGASTEATPEATTATPEATTATLEAIPVTPEAQGASTEATPEATTATPEATTATPEATAATPEATTATPEAIPVTPEAQGASTETTPEATTATPEATTATPEATTATLEATTATPEATTAPTNAPTESGDTSKCHVRGRRHRN